MKQFGLMKSLVLSVGLMTSGMAYAGVDTDTDSNGVILAGHDVVAYFTVGEPVLGDAQYTAVYNDAIYRFSSAQNRDAFTQDPAKYAPVYGGFCAYGSTFGKKFSVDGKAFEIVAGKLYVNKNKSVYKAWKQDVPKHIVEANQQWPAIEHVDKGQL